MTSFTRINAHVYAVIVGVMLLVSSVFVSADQTEIDMAFRDQIISSADPLQVPPVMPVKIAIVLPGIQVSDYWKRAIESMKKRLEELRIRYELDIRFSAPNASVSLQEQQLQSVLARDPDYLIYTLNSSRQKFTVELLLQRDKPKVIIQNLTQPVKEWFDIQPFLYVGFDHERGARELAQYFKQRFPEGTQYGILFWNQGVVSEQRGLAFEREVGSFHTLVDSYYTNASRLLAEEATLKMVRANPRIQYIYACATDVALGALDALQSLGRKDIVVNGWGGGAAELEAYRQGQLDVVLMRMNDQSGIAMAEAIANEYRDKPVPLVYSGDFKLIDKETPSALLDEWVNEAFYYSGTP
jgi:autoinducer 2-binding protein LuxP